MGIHFFDDIFKGDEFNDSIGDLSGPQGSEGFIESGVSFGGFDLVEGGDERSRVSSWDRSLHLNFNGFEGTQEGIGNQFSSS